jgi:hypothetical protein
VLGRLRERKEFELLCQCGDWSSSDDISTVFYGKPTGGIQSLPSVTTCAVTLIIV